MGESEPHWDFEALDALRLMYRSHPDQVSCQRVDRAIRDRVTRISEIDAESELTPEEAKLRAGLRNRLEIEIRKFKKLAAIKGCPEPPV